MPANALLVKGTEEVRSKKSNWRSSFEYTSRNIYSHILDLRSSVRLPCIWDCKIQVYLSRNSVAFVKRLLDGEQSACWLNIDNII